MVALRKTLSDAGMESTDPSGAIETYIKEVAELVRTLKAAKFAVPDPVFESYRPNLSDAIQASGEVRKAELVAESTGVESILCFRPNSVPMAEQGSRRMRSVHSKGGERSGEDGPTDNR